MAQCLNKVMVIGHLGRIPEMRYTPNGTSVANFSIACNRTWKNSEGEKHVDTEWFNVVAWGKLAEIAKQYLGKGSLAYVEGRLQSRSWQDNKGTQHKSVEIVAQQILLLNESNDQNEMGDGDDTEEYPF
jgi:single-strand DNA-binding protein